MKNDMCMEMGGPDEDLGTKENKAPENRAPWKIEYHGELYILLHL